MDERPEGRDVRWGEVVGGVVLGFVACWGFFAVAVFATYLATGESAGRWTTVLVWASLAVVPVALLLTAWARRRRGQLVAGMLLGLTIGSIVGAGVCTTFSVISAG